MACSSLAARGASVSDEAEEEEEEEEVVVVVEDEEGDVEEDEELVVDEDVEASDDVTLLVVAADVVDPLPLSTKDPDAASVPCLPPSLLSLLSARALPPSR